MRPPFSVVLTCFLFQNLGRLSFALAVAFNSAAVMMLSVVVLGIRAMCGALIRSRSVAVFAASSVLRLRRSFVSSVSMLWLLLELCFSLSSSVPSATSLRSLATLRRILLVPMIELCGTS